MESEYTNRRCKLSAFSNTVLPVGPPGDRMNHSKIRVLIVDEDAVMAKYLASHLGRRSFDVSVASSDQEALRVFRSLDPALVLVDTSLEGAVGSEILERLKQIKPGV